MAVSEASVMRQVGASVFGVREKESFGKCFFGSTEGGLGIITDISPGEGLGFSLASSQ